MKRLLVIGGRPKDNWFELFEGKTVGDQQIEVDFASWDDIIVTSFAQGGLVVDIKSAENAIHEKQMKRRTFQPDFLLIRSACFGVYGQNWKNNLMGFYQSNIPSINTIPSLYLCQEKPIIYSYLTKVQKRLGKDYFPLIHSTYYSSWKCMTFSDGFPLVAKVGTAHAGFGKMRIQGQTEFDDLRSVIALQDRYITSEPFIEWDFDFRIQKIGNNYRAFRRYSDNWKGKSWNQTDEDIEVTPKFKHWIDEAANALGMDICALDGVHSKIDDKEYILELNDSAIGFLERHRNEDLNHVVELVLMKMEEAFSPPKIDINIDDGNEIEGGLGSINFLNNQKILGSAKTLFQPILKEIVEDEVNDDEIGTVGGNNSRIVYMVLSFVLGVLISMFFHYSLRN